MADQHTESADTDMTCPDGLPLDPRPFAAAIGGPWKFRPGADYCPDPEHYAEDDDDPATPSEGECS